MGLLSRRRRLGRAVVVLGTALAVLHALSLPVIYEGVAVIQVETSVVTGVSGAPVPGASAQRLQTIEQRLTTRESLQAIIDRHELYAGQPLSGEQKVLRLRQQIRFQPIAAASQPGQVSAVLILARAATADLSARVANDVAQGMVDAAAVGQTGRDGTSLPALTAELARIEDEIRALESDVSAFRLANAAALPEMRDVRRDEIVAVEAELRRLDQALLALRNDRDRIGTGTPRAQDGAARQRIAAITREIEMTQGRRDALAAERAARVETMARFPEVERGLAAQDRRMAQLRVQSDVTMRRLAEAGTEEVLAPDRSAERILLLDRAVSPEHPVPVGRSRRVLLGFLASVILGIGAALVMDLLHPVIRTRSQMERQLGLLPLAVIPDLHIIPNAWRSVGVARDAGRAGGLARALSWCRQRPR